MEGLWKHKFGSKGLPLLPSEANAFEAKIVEP